MPWDEEDDEESDDDDGTVEESLDDDTTREELAPPVLIGVLPQNWLVIDVFRACQPQIAVGMGVLWQGVSAQEVRSACVMLSVKRCDQARVLAGVQLMAHVTARVRNEDEARRLDVAQRER